MKGICLPERKMFLAYCNPPVGSFAMEKEEGRVTIWDHCREQFAAKFSETTEGFYFSHKYDKCNDIVFFINKVEDIIHQSTYCETPEFTKFAIMQGNPHILYIVPTNFWKECFFKRSLYTLLLRCAQNYSINQDNFDDAMFGASYKESTYLMETKPAILRFLFGFTKYTGICPAMSPTTTVIKHGWKEEFYKLEMADIKTRLVLPDGIKINHNIVGSDALWT